MSNKKMLNNAELSAFCQQIAMVLKSGLPAYYGISILCEEAPDNDTRDLLWNIYKPMEEGRSLHEALSVTGVFPKYMLNTIQLGEETGRLDDVLMALSSYFDREEHIRKSVKSAVTYPFVLTVLMLFVIVIMVAKVLPVFSQIYNQLGSELTGVARVLMNISTVIDRYLIVFVVIFVAIIIAGIVLFKTSLGAKLLKKTPLSISIASSRIANCLYLALSSGLDTDRGLVLARELVDNDFMEERINNCKKKIADGETLADALLNSHIFSKMYSSWIAIGTRTGSMDDVMKRICNAYEEESEAKISRYLAVLEPALIVILCVFIGLILISFLLPLLGIMSSIG